MPIAGRTRIPTSIVAALAIVVVDGLVAQPASDLADETKERLLGQWHYELNVPGGGRIVAYRFEIDETNRLVGIAEFIGFADLPERLQGSALPITNMVIDGDSLSFDVPSIGSRFVGEFKRKRIVGRATRPNGAEDLRVSLIQGQYTIPYALDLTEDQTEILQGRGWAKSMHRADPTRTLSDS